MTSEHRCPTCEAPAKIPSPEVLQGRMPVFLCASCGEVNLLVDGFLQGAPIDSLPGEVYDAIQTKLKHLRELRKAAGFVCPDACPACRSALRPTGLLPRDRVLCPACWTFYVTDDGKTLREPGPGELSVRDLEVRRDLLRLRKGPAAPTA